MHLSLQDSHHKSSMQQAFGADRQSLLAEVRDLRANLNILRLQRQEDTQSLSDQLSLTEEHASKRERQLKRNRKLPFNSSTVSQGLSQDLKTGCPKLPIIRITFGRTHF